MENSRFISVILPIRLEWEPCYRLPADLAEETEDVVGLRVKVPFSNKEYVGVISADRVRPDTDQKKIKPVISVERGLSRILTEEIRLWREVAQYYMCSIGEVYKAAYPAGKLNLEEALSAAQNRSALRKEKLASSILNRIERLRDRLAGKEVLAARSKDGSKTKMKAIEQAETLRGQIAAAEKSLAAITESDTGDGQKENRFHPEQIVLTPMQNEAYRQIMDGFSDGKPVMLHGVTGSGKTEIYIKAAMETLQVGKNVLYLVPEIALSRQLEIRLSKYFNDLLMVFHSSESAATRRTIASSIRESRKNGSNYIVLGTRSSLFLPHHDLGLIIVDEEHDSSYKQDSPAPRYNGRDTALMLHGMTGCNILLGSATPSLEEIYNCRTGRHLYVSLDRKYHSGTGPETEIIDTKAEYRKRGMRGSFSLKLINLIKQTLSESRQVLILRSRRAWSTASQCSSCGEIEKCPNCNVSLSYHKDKGKQVCHHCGFTRSHTGLCSKCGGELKSLGAGTQRIEEEASALFPDARIARLDSDSAQSSRYEESVVKAFSEGEIDILIGTQMITKGFDFAKLNLVAVIAADTLLGMMDFRADEKAFQLLEQFKGRCGRRGEKGRFVIQTSQPDHPVYRRLIEDDSNSLRLELLDERQSFGFPPYTRIIEITIRDTNENRARLSSERLALMLEKEGLSVTGPFSPVTDKIDNHHLRKIRISLKKDRKLKSNKESLEKIIREYERSERYSGHIIINVDPS